MGLGTLAHVLRPIKDRFKPEDHPDLLVGLARSDDAAVFRVSDDVALIQTLDFFPPVVDDPYTWGLIAAVNAMSDVYAMGGEVKLALNIAAWPDDLDPDLLAEVFRGGADAVAEAGGVIAGGHTVFDKEPKYGLSVTGMVHPAAIITKGGAQPGDILLLTKPLGTGILMTAAKQQLAGAEAALEGAVASMRRLNRHAAHLARAAGVHAMTDVTGFAITGHAAEMAEQARVSFVLDRGALPELPEARRFASEGAVTGGASRNREQLGDRIQLPADLDDGTGHLLFDPQTSGGLLIAVPEAEAEPLRARIAEVEGGCWVVGRVQAGPAVVVVR